MINDWDKKVDIPLVKLLQPDHVGPYPKVTVQTVIAEFKKADLFPSTSSRYTFNYRIGQALKVLPPSLRVDKVTGRSIGKYFGQKNRAVLGSLCRPLRWYLNGRKEEATVSKPLDLSSNGNAPVKLKIHSAPIESLADLLESKGKHIELRKQVLDAIAECPDDQFRVIPITQQIAENKKERTSIRLAVLKSIAPKGWFIGYNEPRKVFYVVKKDILTKMKKGAK